MGRFDSAIALAQRLIAKNGQIVTLRSFVAAATPDPAKPWKTGDNAKKDSLVDAVFLDYERKYVDGTQIQTGDQLVYMPSTDTSGNAITPVQEGIILRGTVPWKIKDIQPLDPNGQIIMYEIQVRQ